MLHLPMIQDKIRKIVQTTHMLPDVSHQQKVMLHLLQKVMLHLPVIQDKKVKDLLLKVVKMNRLLVILNRLLLKVVEMNRLQVKRLLLNLLQVDLLVGLKTYS